MLENLVFCRAVVGAMLVSLAGVVMIAQPSFLFGGSGINKLGLLLALLQVQYSLYFLPVK